LMKTRCVVFTSDNGLHWAGKVAMISYRGRTSERLLSDRHGNCLPPRIVLIQNSKLKPTLVERSAYDG
jgi:hypothetical protein